jgi:hypothetical protein
MLTQSRRFVGKPFGGGRSLVGAEITGNRAGSDVPRAALGGHFARTEPAELTAPEIRIRDAGPLYRVDRSPTGELQAGANGANAPEIDDRLQQIPGVRMAATSLYAPMSGDSWNNGIRIAGQPEPAAKDDTSAGFVRVMPGFFDALGAKIVLGRPITEEDTSATRKVAVVQ